MRAIRSTTATTGFSASATGLTGLDQATAPFSFGAWVKTSVSGLANTTLWQHMDGTAQNGIGVNLAGKGQFGISVRDATAGTNASYDTGFGFLSYGIWTHLAVRYDGAQVWYYRNGVRCHVVAGTKVPAVSGTRTTSIANAAGALQHELWDIRVFPGLALSASDMEKMCDPTSRILGCKQRLFYQQNWRAAGSGAVTVFDESGNSNNLTTAATTAMAETSTPPNWRSILGRRPVFKSNAVAGALLAITQQPGAINSGAAFSPVVTVEARTDGVTVDTGVTGTVTATITTGSGSLVGTTSRACVAGVATFTGLGVSGSGSHVITFALASYTSAASSSFTVTAATVTISDPESVLTGATFSLTVTRSFAGSGSVTIARTHGSGTLSGTLTQAYVGSVATFSDLSFSGDGIHTITATDYETATDITSNIRVRKLPYTMAGGYHATASFRETRSGVSSKIYYGVQVPTGATSATSLPVLCYIGGSSEAYAGSSAANADGTAGSSGAAETNISNAQTVNAFGVRCNALMATLGCLRVDVLMQYNNEVQKDAWAQSFPDLLDRLVADGYNINRRQVWIMGFSTGGIYLMLAQKYNRSTFAAIVPNDGNFLSGVLTGLGAGGPTYGPYAAGLYDATGADVACMPAVGVELATYGGAVLILHAAAHVLNGNPASRDQADPETQSGTSIVSGLTGALASATAPHWVSNTFTGTLTLLTATRRQYSKSTTLDHGGMNTNMHDATNFPLILAWLQAQSRASSGGGAFARRTRARRIIAVEGA